MGAVPESQNAAREASWATEAFQKQRSYFDSGATRSYDFRIQQLKKLKEAIAKYQTEIQEALAQDIGRPPMEAYIEIATAFEDLKHTIKHLRNWMKPEKVPTTMWAQPGKSRIESVPQGVTFLIGPYNYPFVLLAQPLIGALAAGNTAIMKPSSLNPTVADVIEKMMNEYFDDELVAVYKGSSDVTNTLLEEPFDHIFFTGSARVGKIVMSAAARHLSKVTLELGGKSPTIVHKDANLKVAARRIVAGKMLNVGQTCVAPDHLHVHADIKEEFQQKILETLNEFYGENWKDNPDLGRIINDKHFERVSGLIEPSKVAVGGDTDASQRYVAPTILKDASMDDAAMQEEIFGPVLPVLTYNTIDELIGNIRKLPEYPLALYLFTESEEVEREVLDKTQFGGGCINNTVMHLANPNLPFGGVGESGMGAYHGKNSFDAFSHKRSILKAGTLFDIKFRYPPYKDKVNLLKKMIK
jgi:aldehyde dehydrogenase (NAD+)